MTVVGSGVATDRSELPVERCGSNLRWNTGWTLIGNVVYAACQWGMLIVLAKLDSSKAVGQFGYALAITAPVFQFAGLNLRAIQATDARREYVVGQVLALRLIMLALAMATLLVLTRVAPVSTETTFCILGVGLAKAVESITDVSYGVLQQRERMSVVARSLILRGTIGLLGLTVGVALTGRVAWGALGYALGWAGVLTLHDLPWASRVAAPASLTPCGPVSRLIELAKLAAPFGVVMALISLNAAIPRYGLAHSAGEAAVGVFSALASLTVAGTLVVTSLGAAASPRLARLRTENRRAEFDRLMIRFLIAGTVLGLLGVLLAAVLGGPLLRLLYTEEYVPYTRELVWIMAAGGVGYLASLLGYALTAARVLKPQMALFGLVVLACALTAVWFIPGYGILGAAWAMLTGHVVQLLGSAVLLRVSLRRLTPQSRPQAPLLD
jgi:O-antigen/teichoic acid export membrane protein